MQRNIWSKLLAFAFLFAIRQTASSQEVVVLGLNGDMHSLNPDTGASSHIGDTGHHTYFWNGLSQDSTGRIVSAYGDFSNGYTFYEIDLATAAATPILPTNFFRIESIAFGPNDELFVIHDPKGPLSGGIHDLFSVDLATGNIAMIGSTGVREVMALEWHDGTLFGFDAEIGLVTIDPTTGLATDTNSNFRGPIGSTVSMCFDEQGALYYVDHGLWMMEKDSGIYNPVDWINPFGYWGEAIFVEGPTPHFALWLDGTSGHYMGAKMTGATPNSQVLLMWAKDEGGPSPIPNGLPCAGTMMDLNSNLGKVAIVDTDANGTATVGPGPRRVPAAAKGRVWLQAIDLASCETSNRILLKH